MTPALPLAVTAFADSTPLALANIICPAPEKVFTAVRLAKEPGAAPESMNNPAVPDAMGEITRNEWCCCSAYHELPQRIGGIWDAHNRCLSHCRITYRSICITSISNTRYN